MTFTEPVQDAFSKYATFSGRSSRAAYWWFWLFGVFVTLVAEVIDLVVGTNFVVTVIVSLGLVLPTLAVSARRLHDAGHSAWWLLIAIFPLVGTIVLLIFFLQESKPPNDWGTGPDTLAAPAL